MNLLINKGTKARRGSAMIAGIFVVLVISTLSMSYLQLSLNRSRENAASVDAKRAFYMAESGLAEGYAALVAGKSGVVGSPDEPAVYANGVFWVEATPLSTTRIQLRSTGLSGTGRDSLTVVVERVTRTLAEYGVFGDEGVRVGLGATIDTYDSRTTVADPDAPLDPKETFFETGFSRLRVGSNSDITFIGDRAVTTVIDGDAIPGPAGSVVIGPGVSILGSTTPADATVSLNLIAPPDVRDAGSLQYSTKGGTYLHEPAICRYDTVEILAGKVVIQGPAKLAANSLIVADGAELAFDTTGGPVRMYIADRMVFATGSILSSVEQDPTQLMIALGATDRIAADGSDIKAVTLRATGDFYGFIYSPRADLRLDANLNFYGTMVAKELMIGQNATLHFDEALIDVFTDGSQTVSDMLSWRFVELPSVEIVKTQIDPIKWMKIQGKTLSKPSESHDDNWDGTVDAGDKLSNITKEIIVN